MPADHTIQDEPAVLIAAALDHWWITTDPAAEFHAPGVAHHVQDYLAHHGYTITPATPAVPTSRAIAGDLVVASLAALATTLAVHLGNWVFAAAGAIVTVLTAHETVTDLTTRLTARRNP
ncbi:hypothetical protein AB0F46_01790 [Streptomyces sp. NPDC026665]|uniref:hypothetical protein n=1 Tax=Streptomyces sp. NPDC026665 TaxID=3154798 RepID=UPI0033DEE73A